MSFWKVLGGAVVGVGAVAAAPFTGGGSVLGAASLLGSLAGGATIAGAGAAAVAGGIVGNALSDAENRKEEDIKREAEKKAKAEAAVETQKYKEKLEEYKADMQKALEELKARGDFFKGVLALEAVGLAVANCDGIICDKEQAEIDGFIKGISHSNLPDSYKMAAKGLRDDPPSVEDAFELARNSGLPLEMFRRVIENIVEADEIVHEREEQFLEDWAKLETHQKLAG